MACMKKVDEHTAVAKYNVTPIDTTAFEGEPMQIRSRIDAREFKSGDRPDLYAGTPPREALKAINPIKANIIGAGSAKSIESDNTLGRERNSVSARSPTCGRSR